MKTFQASLSLSNEDSFGRQILPYAMLAKLDTLYRKKIHDSIADAKNQVNAVIRDTKKQVSKYLKTKS